MKWFLVDSNIILDIFPDDPDWADWSESALANYSDHTTLYINTIIYTEVSLGFKKIEESVRNNYITIKEVFSL